MSKTATKLDIKTWSKAEAQKRANTVVARLLEAREKNKWEEVDEMHFFSATHGYTQSVIVEIWRIAYCRFYKISLKGNKTDDKHYNSFSTTIIRYAIVACLDEKRYSEYRESGMSVTAVWAKVTGTGKRRHKQIADGEESVEHKGDVIKKLQKEAEEDVVNAKELLEGANTSKKVSEISDKKDEKKTSWTADLPDENSKWIKDSRQILRDDPMLFVRMIQQCVEVNLLSEKVLTLVRREVIKK